MIKDPVKSDQFGALSSILLASVNVDHRSLFETALPDTKIVASPEQLSFLVGAATTVGADILVVDCDELTDAILIVLEEVMARHPMPILVFAERGTSASVQRALRVGVASCVIDGLAAHRLEVLIALACERFRISSELVSELEKTRNLLESRKIIERAKGVLMTQRGLAEADAYQLMRQNAMSQNKTMRQVAESILSILGIIG